MARCDRLPPPERWTKTIRSSAFPLNPDCRGFFEPPTGPRRADRYPSLVFQGYGIPASGMQRELYSQSAGPLHPYSLASFEQTT